MSDKTAPAPSDTDRNAHVTIADAENRIDGLFRDPRTDPIFEAYIAGEIAVTDIAPRLYALLGL